MPDFDFIEDTASDFEDADIFDFQPEEEVQRPEFTPLPTTARLSDVLQQPSPILAPWEGGVVRSVLPGVLQPEDLRPAIRLIGGDIAEGKLGDTHPDIIDRENIPAIEIDQRGFTGPQGEFYDREAAAQGTGLPTEFESGRLHSTDLSAFQEEPTGKPTFEPPLAITEAGPVYPPEPTEALRATPGMEFSPLELAQRFRASEYGRKLFGPTSEELQAMGGTAGSQVGVTQVGQAVMPILPVGIGGLTGRALMAYFTEEFIRQQPEIYSEAKKAYERKDWDTLRNIVTEDVLGGAMMAVGAKTLAEPVKPGALGVFTEPAPVPVSTVPEVSPKVIPSETRPRTLTPAVREGTDIQTGIDHGTARIQQARRLGRISTKPQDEIFVDENGNVLTRQEAAVRFEEITGKKPNIPDALQSEDLKQEGILPQLRKAPDEVRAIDLVGMTPDEVVAWKKGIYDEAKRLSMSKDVKPEEVAAITTERDRIYAEYQPKVRAAEAAGDAYNAAKKKGDEAEMKRLRPLQEKAMNEMQAAFPAQLKLQTLDEMLLDAPKPVSKVETKPTAPTLLAPAEAATIPENISKALAIARQSPNVFKSKHFEGDMASLAQQYQIAINTAIAEKAPVYAKWAEELEIAKGGTLADSLIRRGWKKEGTVFKYPSTPHPTSISKVPEAPKSAEPTDPAETLSNPSPPVEAPSIGAGIQAALMRKAEAGSVTVPKGVTEAVQKSADYVNSLANEELKAPKMTDRRRAILNWSAKLQRSFIEAGQKQRDIVKAVPNQTRREGITNWIQADGDATVLRQRANATVDPKLKAGYEAALNLTPEEVAIANQVKADYAAFASRGQAADVLGQLKDNYVTQTWDLGKGPGGTGVGRTLKEKFRFSKASTFKTFFEGEQLGYKPKTKDIAKLLPMYSHEMNSVIAAREMVAEMGNGVASDGRPLLVPKGAGVPVESAEGGKATLVMPKVGKVETSDYKVLANQPALSDWKWVAKDDAGNPVFLKADLALHPEAFKHLRAVLGRSAIRDWYGTRTTALAEIPKALVRGINFANSETKRTMLGLLATFHQIQTGTHAIGHRVNPLFNIPKLDLVRNPVQMDAAQHGLMLAPDRASMDQFMEGFRTSGIISRIPVIGPIADWYGHYLFHEYIPGLKFKTYDAILNRNLKVYAKDLKAGKVNPDDVKILSAEQANAAYGHINYADLGRNPTMQHIAQLGLLAPDFLEARGRFAGQALKGIGGAKVGREQLLALATLAIAQAAAAYAAAKITDGEWDQKRPFEFVKGNRRYTLRSVPEDVQNLVTKTRQFIHSRLSPLVGKGTLQYLTGVDYRGQRVKGIETTKELLAQPIPLTIRGFTGLGRSTLSSMEQLAGSLGLRISRYSPSMDVYDMVRDFRKSSDDPKIQSQLELQEKEVFASVYDKLRTALHNEDMQGARKEYEELKKIRTPNQINDALKPWTGGNLNRETLEMSPRKPRPFTGSAKTERQFIASLTEDQREAYHRAAAERVQFYQTFRTMLKTTGQ